MNKPSYTEEELRALLREATLILAYYAEKSTWDNWKDENGRVHPPTGAFDNGIKAQIFLTKVKELKK
jgi:hypothetical protein